MEEHINPTILDNFENNCESMDIKRTNQQGVLRGVVDSGNLQFMNIHSRDQEFIDHTLLGPEYIGNTISNSFMIDLMDEEQHDPSVQASADCPIASLGSNEAFPSEAQLHTILQFVNRQGHVRNQPGINIVESSNDHLIHHSDKDIIESEFLAIHGNLLNDQNFKLFCSQQIIPIQEGLGSDLNVPPLQSLPATSSLPTTTTWLKKETYKDPPQETPDLMGGPLGATAKKVLPHKKRISKKLKNLDKDEVANFDMAISPESPPRINRFVVSNGSHYECELCGAVSETQVQFFSHLKGHYEPSSIVKETECPMQRIPTTSIIAVVDEPVLKETESPSTAVVQDHQVFNEVELNFDNFNEVVELTAQEHHHQQHHENAPSSTDMKILDSNSIEECMEYVVQAQEPTQVVCNVHEEVEFSDTEDMLEGIRGVVDKVSIDDTSNDLDMHPRDISKESWFTNNAFNGIPFKEEIITNEDFERRTDLMQMATTHETADDHKTPINSPSEFKDEDFNDNTHEGGSSELNDSINVQENANVKRRGRPRSTAVKKPPKVPHTDDDDESSQEFPDNNKRRYICTKCNREFNSCNALKYHNLSHTGERPHQCEVCGKSFYAQSALKSHMRLHTGDKPYECEQCHRKFRQWSDLKYHIVSIHSDVKNYTCEFCGKSFSRKYSLVIHRRIHTSERNYKCEFCPKSFRASSYLQNHRKIHTGEKPYTCETCGKKFRVGGDLRRHFKTHERKAQTDLKNTNSNPNVEVPVTVQSKNPNVNKLNEMVDDIKNDVLLKIEYQKESKDDLLFLDKMASKINHLFKTEEDFVNEDLGNSDLSFAT
ncbi:zinc finger imprinted 2 [Eupeodes corollae]|uniref:zinc finger imprinted 2 n=1 Tax=Eupeodes corollae TaxID=290404 RepID=UPI002491FFC8|nr:zinc finger imprinted 2 [Eupeodes corollae]